MKLIIKKTIWYSKIFLVILPAYSRDNKWSAARRTWLSCEEDLSHIDSNGKMQEEKWCCSPTVQRGGTRKQQGWPMLIQIGGFRKRHFANLILGGIRIRSAMFAPPTLSVLSVIGLTGWSWRSGGEFLSGHTQKCLATRLNVSTAEIIYEFECHH